MRTQPILEWWNRGVGGERVGDLWNAIQQLIALGATDAEEIYDLMFDEPSTALVLHRAHLRVQADLLLRRATRLQPWTVSESLDFELATEAYTQLLERMATAMRAGASELPGAAR